VSIVRAKRPDSGFLILSNDVARDERLSYRALGLLTLILSRPDDWRTNYQQLARGEGREGQAAVLTALKELEATGYLIRRRLQDARGRWTWEHLVYDTPQDVPAGQTMSQKPRRGSPFMETCDSLEVLTTENLEEDGVNRPAEAAAPEKIEFGDWRATDRALFKDAIEGERLTSDGSFWNPGTWSVDDFYDAFRKRERGKPLQWPGRYISGMVDTNGVEDWLCSQGLEIVA
jgi:hypothetical protein